MVANILSNVVQNRVGVSFCAGNVILAIVSFPLYFL